MNWRFGCGTCYSPIQMVLRLSQERFVPDFSPGERVFKRIPRVKASAPRSVAASNPRNAPVHKFGALALVVGQAAGPMSEFSLRKESRETRMLVQLCFVWLFAMRYLRPGGGFRAF
jgi:hypothetical protein